MKTSLPGFPRYRMSEAGDPGDCDLVIDPVLPADEAVFQCQVMGPGPIVSGLARLRVRAEPGQPYISQATDSAVKEVMMLCFF